MTREKFTPIYFNFGMVIAPGDMMQAIGELGRVSLPCRGQCGERLS